MAAWKVDQKVAEKVAAMVESSAENLVVVTVGETAARKAGW